LEGTLYAPPSKAYTQRMLIASALSHGNSNISDPLVSDDTHATLRAVKALGAKVVTDKNCWMIEGASQPKSTDTPIDCGESAATLRFMIPVAALSKKPSVFIFGKSLEKRPIAPLFQSLKQLGALTYFESLDGRPSIVVKGGGISGGKTLIPGNISSQFISGLMFACPLAEASTEIAITTKLESKDYVQMTRSVLAEHGIKISISGEFNKIHISSNQTYKPCNHVVPGDFSSAAFLFAVAAITRSKLQIGNLGLDIIQGDKEILGILERIGVHVRVYPDRVEIDGRNSVLKAIDLNVTNIPDLVPVVTVLACYAKGTSKIHDAHRLRYKESDRLLSLYLELTKMGAQITMEESALTVEGPCRLHGATIDPHNDHRIAMACSVAGLGASGKTRIQNAECVRKSYPRFFHDLRELGADIVGGELDR